LFFAFARQQKAAISAPAIAFLFIFTKRFFGQATTKNFILSAFIIYEKIIL
jgi:hypothetical protein